MMRGKRALDGLDADIRDHIDRETRDNVERGLPPDEARRQALLAFGNVAVAKEETAAVWVLVWAEHLLQDVRYALRTLGRNRGFAAAVILTMALAIGMNAAMFSVFNAIVLRPIGYPAADRLVWLSTSSGDGDFVAAPDFADWREQATSFERMVAYGTFDRTLVSTRGATRARTATVTDDFWDLSGAAPEAGRVPRTGEEEAVLLSNGFARRWFPGDADLVGRTIAIDGEQVTIVGVLPGHFKFQLPSGLSSGPPGDVDVYQPMVVTSARGGQVQLLNTVGRLKSGVPLARAQAEVEAIRTRTAQAHPNPSGDRRRLRIVPLHDELIGGAENALLVLLGAVTFVLLIACANAASLLLARASVRQREIAVRMSIGAGRGRVLRQLLGESLVLAVPGSAAGLLLADLGVAMMLRVDPYAIPRLAETTIDGRVIAVVLGTSVLTVFVFGLAPALALRKLDPHDVLKSGNRMSSPAAVSVRFRRALVAGEVALALVLLAGAGLMLKSAWRMGEYTPGFEPRRVLTAKVELSGPTYFDPHRQLAFADVLLDRLKAEPGVEAASISTHGYMLTRALMVEGEPEPAPDELASKAPIAINATSMALKQVMGFRIVRGRWFTDDEPAAVLNENLARRDFPGKDPIGLRFQLSEASAVLTIVGIVADVKYSKLDAPAGPEVYVPYRRTGDGLFGFTALIRATNDPLALAPAVRRLVADIDKTQVADELMTLDQALAASIAPRRLNLALFGTFAAAALFLALIGIYGVMAYTVAQRIPEIGIRIALGAQRAEVVGMVLRQGMRVTLVGIIAGLIGALTLSGLMEGLLYEVQPTDPWTFAAVTAAVATTAFLACCVPALEAALVDPVITLRYE